MAQTLTTSQILADLQSGLTRKDIGVKYGLNGAQVASLFKNPTLKHKKTIKEKGAAFILIDDVAGEQTAATETAEAATTDVVNETAEAQENAFEQAEVAEEVAQEEEAASEIQPEPVVGERSMWGE